MDATASGAAAIAGRAFGLVSDQRLRRRTALFLSSPTLRRMCTARRASWRRWVADGEAVWSWHPLLVSSRRRFFRAQPGLADAIQFADDGDKRNSSPGRARSKPLKPLCREGRVASAEPVVTPCALFCTGAAGAASARLSLRPLLTRDERSMKTSGAMRRGNAKSYVMHRTRKLSVVITAHAGDPVFQRRRRRNGGRGV